MTTSNPSFWIASCATPTVLFVVYVLFQWFLGEDPREAWFKEENVKNWEFLLGDQGLDQNIGPPKVLSYGVFDPSVSFSSEVRQAIINNDCFLFLKSTLGMRSEKFEAFSEAYSDKHTSLMQDLAKLRQQFASNSTNRLANQLLNRVELSEDVSNVVEVSILQEHIKQWVMQNQDETVDLIPNLSFNLFREQPPLDSTHSRESLESMLSRNEIIGFFVLPDSISNDLDHLHFVTTVSTPRSEFIDLLNWYRTVATDVLKKRRYESEDIDSIAQAMLLQRVDVVPLDVELTPSRSQTTTESFLRILYIGLAVLLYLTLLVGSVRLVSNVVEEKSNKLADNLLASLNPTQLLDGKLWGTAMISLTVLGLWIVLVPILVFVTGRFDFVVDLDIFRTLLRPAVFFNFALFLLLAFALYGYLFVGFASLYSKVGNAINSFVGIVLGIGILFVFPSLAVMSINPPLWTQNLLSFFPVVSPFVMVARTGNLPGLGVYCTIVFLLVLCIFASRALANSMFKRGISSEVRVKPLKYRAAKRYLGRVRGVRE